MEFIQSQPLLIPCALAYVGLLLDLVGTAILGNGGVFWYYFFFFLLTNTIVLVASRLPALAKDLQLLQLVLLAISIAYMPSGITVGINFSSVQTVSSVNGIFSSTVNNNLASGGACKAAGLIITILMMFVQLLIISVPAKLLGLEPTAAPATPANEEKHNTIVAVA